MEKNSFDLKNLLNNYDGVDKTIVFKKEIYIYGENQSRFDEILRNYIDMKKKRISVVFHYMINEGESIFSDFESINFINNSIIRDNYCDFDIPMFSALTGIKIIGIGDHDNMKNAYRLAMHAIHDANELNEKKVGIVLPDFILEYDGLLKVVKEYVDDSTLVNIKRSDYIN